MTYESVDCFILEKGWAMRCAWLRDFLPPRRDFRLSAFKVFKGLNYFHHAFRQELLNFSCSFVFVLEEIKNRFLGRIPVLVGWPSAQNSGSESRMLAFLL